MNKKLTSKRKRKKMRNQLAKKMENLRRKNPLKKRKKKKLANKIPHFSTQSMAASTTEGDVSFVVLSVKNSTHAGFAMMR